MIVFVELPQVAARQEANVAVRQRLRELRLGQLLQKCLGLAWMAVRTSLGEVLLELVDGQGLTAERIARADRDDPQHSACRAEPGDARIVEHSVVDQHHRANLQECG